MSDLTLDIKALTRRFGVVTVETKGDQHGFDVQLYLNDIDANAVRVELYADGPDGSSPQRQEMKRIRQLDGARCGYGYTAAVPATRPAGDYTPRVIPWHEGVAIPLESAQILWRQRSE
jgi:glycogen phosphorylase